MSPAIAGFSGREQGSVILTYFFTILHFLTYPQEMVLIFLQALSALGEIELRPQPHCSLLLFKCAFEKEKDEQRLASGLSGTGER